MKTTLIDQLRTIMDNDHKTRIMTPMAEIEEVHYPLKNDITINGQMLTKLAAEIDYLKIKSLGKDQMNNDITLQLSSLDNEINQLKKDNASQLSSLDNEINQLKKDMSSIRETYIKSFNKVSQEIAILKSTSEHNSWKLEELNTHLEVAFDIENTTRAYQQYKKNLSDEVDRLMMVQSEIVFDEKSVGVGELASYAYKQSQQALKLIKAYNDAILNVQPVMAYFGEISGAIFDARFNHLEANNHKYIKELLKPYLDNLERPA